ncbi:MAG: HAMP domain-containing sensor histidine kinase [Cyanobacteria bacterium P01_F01_bin.33]
MNRPRLGLRLRLLLSHLAVMGVGVGALLIVGRLTSPYFFVQHLDRMRVGRATLRVVRTELVDGFQLAWTKSARWSLVFGVSTAGALGTLISRRISAQLRQMEDVAKQFTAGEFESRVPPMDIPELDRLGQTFNQMAEGLQDVERRRRDLIGDLSHELRSPLTVLEGYLEGFAEGSLDASPELYARMADESARLRRLVNDLQELSKAEAGHLPISACATDAQPVLERVCDRLRLQIDDSGPMLTLDLPEKIPWVLADRDRLEQILTNLVGNAIRYTPAGQISVSAEPRERWLWISVVDTGCGISETDLPFVFERFWRADRSRSRGSGGSGIGLAIVKRLVELQGGEISASSTLGQGSAFRFSLPLAPKQ